MSSRRPGRRRAGGPAGPGGRRGVLARAGGPARCGLVDQPPGGDGDQPAARVVRHAVGGPLRGRGQQRLLDGVLARVELAVAADQRAEDLRRQLAQQVLGGVRRSLTSSRARPRT